MPQQPFLTVRNIEKKYGTVAALDGVSLNVEAGEFVCLVGPSGCGKTTLLRTIAGLEMQDRGTIILGTRDISNLAPQSRDYGILFQSYALFPNLTVAQNIAFGLETKRTVRSHVRTRIAEMLEMVGLPGFEDRYPAQLSGGQQQRVGLARALAPAPSLLLLDEPMSALDAKVREHLQTELRELQKRLSITTLMVTHDQHEAMAMADRIAVMDKGQVQQVGSAQELYCNPSTKFVAGFIGDANWLDCERLDQNTVKVGDHVLHVSNPLAQHQGMICIRPESVKIMPVKPLNPKPNSMMAHIVERVFLGTHYQFSLKLEGAPNALIRSMVSTEDVDRYWVGQVAPRCWLNLPQEACHTYA